MSGPRLASVLVAVLLANAFVRVSQGRAQDYPTRPVRIIVPFGAGGPADVTARLIGDSLQRSFGQPFVAENHTGAGGGIGTLEGVRAPPDGYTLLMLWNKQAAK